jgi:hypothetical protein
VPEPTINKGMSEAVTDVLTSMFQDTNGDTDRLQRLLHQMDADCDGQLDRDEMFVSCREHFGLELSELEMDALMLAFDDDGNGSICFSELQEAARNYAAIAKDQGCTKHAVMGHVPAMNGNGFAGHVHVGTLEQGLTDQLETVHCSTNGVVAASSGECAYCMHAIRSLHG